MRAWALSARSICFCLYRILTVRPVVNDIAKKESLGGGSLISRQSAEQGGCRRTAPLVRGSRCRGVFHQASLSPSLEARYVVSTHIITSRLLVRLRLGLCLLGFPTDISRGGHSHRQLGLREDTVLLDILHMAFLLKCRDFHADIRNLLLRLVQRVIRVHKAAILRLLNTHRVDSAEQLGYQLVQGVLLLVTKKKKYQGEEEVPTVREKMTAMDCFGRGEAPSRSDRCCRRRPHGPGKGGAVGRCPPGSSP